jgi:hypothetical protein
MWLFALEFALFWMIGTTIHAGVVYWLAFSAMAALVVVPLVLGFIQGVIGGDDDDADSDI